MSKPSDVCLSAVVGADGILWRDASGLRAVKRTATLSLDELRMAMAGAGLLDSFVAHCVKECRRRYLFLESRQQHIPRATIAVLDANNDLDMFGDLRATTRAVAELL